MKKFMNMIAYIGLVCVAAALLLAKILGWLKAGASVVSALATIGQCFAYIVTMVYAFHYVRGKRNVWWWVTYWVAVVVVVAMVILTLV